MRKSSLRFIVALILTAICAATGFAQGNQTYQQRWFFASDFGQWSIKSAQASTYQWSPGSICQVNANGSATNFFAFATTAPVTIVDATPANSEVVTPSAVTNSNAFCSITVSPSHTHYSFQVTSGTGGLQEALNNISPTAVAPSIVWLDRNWYALANNVPGTTPAAIISAATGGVSAILVDNTTAGFTYYVWGGTAYASGTWVNTAPTAATGAATGTATSKVATGTALAGTYSFTTGTGTTGTVFTETWATSAQFQYQPVCTVVSTGATAPPTLTVTPTYGSSHALLTVSVASALASTTAYSFQWACH
ncbi:MAG: hypothetical protein WB608_16240 [Terracidiphilus sp.]